MSYISRFSKQAWFWVVLVLLLVELIARILPWYKAAGGGVLLTNQRAQLLEARQPEFDYLIFGESRSLSLLGHAPTQAEPYSVYNFSVPAMGSHYYAYYFRKYMKSRKSAPAALIFAGDPTVFEQGWNSPLHDPDKVYTDKRGQGFASYLQNRFTRRIQQALQFGSDGPVGLHQSVKDRHWDTYKHRYLHLFSFTDLMEQYSGPERLYILSEKMPLLYATFRWREPIAHYSLGFKPDYLFEQQVPAHCTRSCASANDPTCYPDYSRLQANRNLLEDMRATYGQVNLADRKSPANRRELIAFREQAMQNFKDGMQVGEPDLGPLEALARETARHNTRLILAYASTASEFQGMAYHRKYHRALQPILAKYPHIREVPFGLRYLPAENFIDNAHYTCEGAQRVNTSFYEQVMPQILKLAPPLQDGRKNGF